MKVIKLGIIETLTLIFIILKLFGVITWSWWLVTLPITSFIGFAIILFAIMGATHWFSGHIFKREK